MEVNVPLWLLPNQQQFKQETSDFLSDSPNMEVILGPQI